mmetsp:Transcript_17603/g.43950  ORF Transcript_17603/g.43950 Transcript_17603/m.43950 type:complete len:247 (+) Transcript_17603:1-741(+)
MLMTSSIEITPVYSRSKHASASVSISGPNCTRRRRTAPAPTSSPPGSVAPAAPAAPPSAGAPLPAASEAHVDALPPAIGASAATGTEGSPLSRRSISFSSSAAVWTNPAVSASPPRRHRACCCAAAAAASAAASCSAGGCCPGCCSGQARPWCGASSRAGSRAVSTGVESAAWRHESTSISVSGPNCTSCAAGGAEACADSVSTPCPPTTRRLSKTALPLSSPYEPTSLWSLRSLPPYTSRCWLRV